MRSTRFVLLTFIIVVSAFGAIFYTSCSKDTCKTVNCQNGSTCSGGECQCNTQQSGLGGASCEVIFEELYANNYVGNATRDSSNYAIIDTNNILNFQAVLDTPFTKMNLTWTDPAFGGSVTFDVTLTTFSANNYSSTFTLDSKPLDTFSVTGSGSVSGTTASVSLVATHPAGPPIYINLVNFTKKP